MTVNKFYNLRKNVLYPICRSITGNGQKKTLKIIKKEFPNLNIKIRSGKKVFDWKIPPEWNIKDAYVIDKFGVKIIDFKQNNLHVMYSSPVKKLLKIYLENYILYQINLGLFHILQVTIKKLGFLRISLSKKK